MEQEAKVCSVLNVICDWLLLSEREQKGRRNRQREREGGGRREVRLGRMEGQVTQVSSNDAL